jgi:hypothetical protein
MSASPSKKRANVEVSGASEEAVSVWSVAECKAALVPSNRDDKETVIVVLGMVARVKMVILPADGTI